ncbi:hypothetical protein [Sphaerisporangium rufum]|uniref:hypothetical protein n=1 Tax=Sphaerisporangium rufum TaxID=1381558 RepID=UPI00194DCC3E|nr:hypothetical protein [Sphaerisporangium rufum]
MTGGRPLPPYPLGARTPAIPGTGSMIALFGAGAPVSRVTARGRWSCGPRRPVGAVAAARAAGRGSLIGAGGA